MINLRLGVCILSHEIAEDLFVGWLGNLDWSWRVVAGQNPAYDQFPCQYQLFYRGKAKGSFWYEPVFQIKTLDGKLVWRRRKYRVKRGKVAGTFYFSVLDNGVVSNEYWTTVDVSKDFSWGLFHYSGAARVARQSYTGAVLHNCLDLDAKIPEKPFVPPMVKFQEKILSHEIAEDLFVDWLGNLDWSWRVVAGQNPAYDQFPCQYQLFYRGKAKGSFWYEPVFQVKTLDGKLVWRRRKYRVKRGKVAGTFYFSVLDNGVVSNKYWTIVDVPEDFSWGLFHYSGAARVAGQSYTGAVLVSPNGEYPNETEKERLVSALDRCCIKEWELFDVDNCQCNDPPLGLPEGSRFTTTLTAIPSDNLGDSQATSRWDTFPWRLVVGELSLGNAR
ncbi:violaxanthin de-epoxidase, chloroplastic [Tanacetum coccineum]